MIFGNVLTDLNILSRIETKVPVLAAGYWEEMRHDELFNCLIDQAQSRYANVSSIRFALSPTNADFAGCIEYKFIRSGDIKWNVSIGVTNSNNRGESMQIYGGLILSVRDTLVGFPVLSEGLGKHTASKIQNIGTSISEFIDKAKHMAKSADGWLSRLEKNHPSEKEIQAKLHIAGRFRWMPWSRIGRIDAMIAEHQKAGNKLSMCDLIKLFSLVAQMSPPLKQMKNIYKFVDHCTH